MRKPVAAIGNQTATDPGSQLGARQPSTEIAFSRASMSMARLWRDQGKRTEARDLLAPIYSWFTEGFETPALQEAKTLLDELA